MTQKDCFVYKYISYTTIMTIYPWELEPYHALWWVHLQVTQKIVCSIPAPAHCLIFFSIEYIAEDSSTVQTQVPLLSRNTLNTNLMHGHRDSSVSPYSLPEITEQRIFHVLFYCEQIGLKP